LEEEEGFLRTHKQFKKHTSFVLVLLLIVGMFSPVFASLEGGVGGGGSNNP